MYTIKRSSDVYGRKMLCRVGLPQDVEPDLCFVATADRGNYLSINSVVLRQALLSNPKLLKEVLKIKVVDLDPKNLPKKNEKTYGKGPVIVNKKLPPKKMEAKKDE